MQLVLQQSSNYLGCCTKSTPITAVDEPSKGLKIRGRIVERPAVPNDLWSTDTCEIDDGEIHSMKNISSVRTSIQVQNCHGTAGTSNSFEYVNHGKYKAKRTFYHYLANNSILNKKINISTFHADNNRT